MEVKAILAAVKKPFPEDPDQNFDILHLCAYPSTPTQDDFIALVEELATDEEFGMIGMKEGVDYQLVRLKDDAVKNAIACGVVPAVLEEDE